jgi:hypothetical protein
MEAATSRSSHSARRRAPVRTSSPDNRPSPFQSWFLNERSLPRHSSRVITPSWFVSMAWNRIAAFAPACAAAADGRASESARACHMDDFIPSSSDEEEQGECPRL